MCNTVLDNKTPHSNTLIRKSLTCFVRTKPRGSIVITKPLALGRSLCCVLAKLVGCITCFFIIKSCWLNHFVLPRGQYTPIIPLAKTNGTQLTLSAQELTLLLLTV